MNCNFLRQFPPIVDSVSTVRAVPARALLSSPPHPIERAMEGCHDEAVHRNDPGTLLFIVDGLDRLVRGLATLSERSGATARPRGWWATRRAREFHER